MSDLIPWFMPWSGRILVSIIVLLGVIVVAWGLRRRRSSVPRCRRCGYELTGLPALKCPECNWTAHSPAHAMFGKRRWWLVALSVLIMLALPTYIFIKRTKQFGWEYYLTFGPGHYFFGLQTLDEVAVDGVTVRIIRDRSPNVWEQTVEFTSKAGVTTLHNRMFEIGFKRVALTYGRGEDITGNSKPDIILIEFTGGAHCCFIDHVYEVDPPGTIREIVTLDARDGGGFEDRDGDTLPEFVVEDWTWEYQLTCFACLRYPIVVMKFDGNTFVPDPELMRTPASTESPSEFARRIYREEQEQGLNARDALYGEMLYRIYTGHADSAWQCFEVAWRPDMGDQHEALTKFLEILHTSPYLDALRELNGTALDPPAELNSPALP